MPMHGWARMEPTIYHHFHQGWSVAIADALNSGLLPSRFSALIERHTGADIPLIFEREGEAGFRRREAEAIADLTARSAIVLATGGGAVLSPASRQHLKTRGWVVYLETTVAQQAERATRTRNRPLLNGGDARQRLQELMAIREPLYREVADLAVPTTRKRVHQVADQIVLAYRAAHA